jgi:mevalonate kinase
MKICSGIHSTTSTQGGIVYFENNRKEDIHCEQVPFSRAKNQFPIAIVEPAELEKNTSPAAMARVFEYKDQLGEIDKENQIFETVYMIMNRVTQLGKKSLEAYDLRKLGSLMTLQHDLLRTIGASDPSVELLLLEIAKIDFGNSDAILGAKITGAGGKGSSILILYNPTCFGKNIRDEFVGRIEEFKGVLAESIAHERGVSVEMPPKRSEYSTVSPVLSSQDRARLLREKTR